MAGVYIRVKFLVNIVLYDDVERTIKTHGPSCRSADD